MQIDDLIWMIPVTLFVIAVIQILYVAWLASSLRRGKRRGKQPDAPIMPTQPCGLMDTAHGGANPNLDGGAVGKMVVLRGIPNLKEIPLPGNNFRVGRFYNPDSNVLVALDERSISRQHALFVSDETTREYYLTDTNSSYGTRIQIEHRLETLPPGREQRLYNEDVVQFGNVVTLRFILPCETRPAGAKLY